MMWKPFEFAFKVMEVAGKALIFNDRSTKTTGAKFLPNKEVQKLLNYNNRGVLVDGINKRLSEEESYKHVVILSPAGGGKTTKYIIPNILTLDRCSMVITDPSGEIYNKTSGYLSRRGFKIKVLNPTSPLNSLKYNPLAKVTNDTEIGEIAKILVSSANPDAKDTFWLDGAETIIEVLIKTLKNTGNNDYINLHNVLHLLQNFGDKEKIDNFIAKNAPQTAYNQYKGFFSGNEKTMQSFLSTAITSLKMFNNVDIANVTAYDELDFQKMRTEKTALFLIIPSQRISYYSFLMNLFYTQLFQECMLSLPNKREYPIYCLMDEAGHAKIPNFETIISTIRKYNVSISFILQSISQLSDKFGEHKARTIFTNMSTKIFYSGLDHETSKLFEQMLGKVQQTYTDKETGRVLHHEYNLMNSDQIRTMQSNQGIFISSNNPPVLFDVKSYFEQGSMNYKTTRRPYKYENSSFNKSLKYVDL